MEFHILCQIYMAKYMGWYSLCRLHSLGYF
nr:MAG TPA: hypothetical protein [Caudoviricetes sp.]